MSRPPENPPIPFPRTQGFEPTTIPDGTPPYAELQSVSNFSFLRGASHPGELVLQAKALGLSAIGIADRNSVAGIVRAHSAAKKEGMRLIVGARIDTLPHGFHPRVKDGRNEKLADSSYKDARPGFSCLVYPKNRAGWGRLCRLLTKGKRAAQKGECHLTFEDLLSHLDDQIVIALPPADFWKKTSLVQEEKQDARNVIHLQSHREKQSTVKRFDEYLKLLMPHVKGRLWIAAHWLYTGDDRRRLCQLDNLAKQLGLPLVATNDVHFHHPDRRPLQDIITCIREKCTLTEAGFRLAQHAERHLKPPHEMARLFVDYPEALAATQAIADQAQFSLDELSYHYPHEPVPPGKTPQEHLTDLTWQGAAERYPDGVPDHVCKALKKELALIETLNYAPYFLTVHDIVAYAKEQEILCQGRGSAANSAVCYCIGVTAVDPSKINLLFERFLSMERQEPPDIDVDFEHEKREKVIQYVYERYGRHRAGLTATVITYRPRSAVREVGKVMGLTEDVTAALASTVWGSWGKEIPKDQISESGLDLSDPHLKRTIALTQELLGFPRHLSQHVGGFVLTEDVLEETVPIGNAAMEERTFIEWDKDDIDELRIMKVDVLALGMLSCIRKCFDLLRKHYRQDYTLATLPQEDPAVYAMLQKGDSLGTFQVESRAQMNMLPRLKPKEFYDLVIQVAIVRPGPIQGDMVHPYLRRRDGLEEPLYPKPKYGDENELKNILNRTLGVPLFQEQAMQIAIDAAKFSAEEANELRKAMATFRRAGTIHTLEQKMVGNMIRRGYDPDFARRCFDQIKGFGEYGFPESHAASFALLVYVSSWIKCHHPDVFCAGLLNAQPMGFYAPAQIVRDAREHGIEVRPIDVNHSFWDNTLEENYDGSHAVRLGFRQADGLSEDVMTEFITQRHHYHGGSYQTLEELRRRTGLALSVLERLAGNDAFRSLGLDRRQGLWTVRGLMSDTQLPLFSHAAADAAGQDVPVTLPKMRKSEHVVADYQTHRLSLKAHPISFLRERYRREGIIACQTLFEKRQKQRCAVAGVVLVRQRPGTAKGVVFMTIEDETGIANIVIWKKEMEKFRKTVMTARLVKIIGEVQRVDDIIHVVAHRVVDLTGDLDLLSDDPLPEVVARADHVKSPITGRAHIARKQDGDLLLPLAHADEVKHPQNERGGISRDRNGIPLHATERPTQRKGLTAPARGSHPRNVRIIPKSRDFH